MLVCDGAIGGGGGNCGGGGNIVIGTLLGGEGEKPANRALHRVSPWLLWLIFM